MKFTQFLHVFFMMVTAVDIISHSVSFVNLVAMTSQVY